MKVTAKISTEYPLRDVACTTDYSKLIPCSSPSLLRVVVENSQLSLLLLEYKLLKRFAVDSIPAWVGILIIDGAYIVNYLKLIPGSLIKVVAETNSQMFYSCLSINLFIFPLAHYFSSPQLFIHILLVLSTLSENLIAQCSGCRNVCPWDDHRVGGRPNKRSHSRYPDNIIYLCH